MRKSLDQSKNKQVDYHMTTVKNERKFNNKTFELAHWKYNKTEATKAAKSYRKKGVNARIIKNKGNLWFVYKEKK